MSTDQVVVAGFPITADMGLTRREAYFDIWFEVSNHGRTKYDYFEKAYLPSDGTWCYYVWIDEQMLSPEEFANFWLPVASVHKRSSGWDKPFYAYSSARFADAEWHGGVTYFEKLGGIDGAARSVKIGCDFAHIWDQDCTYSYESVRREAIATIESLRSMYSFKRCCVWSGRWLPEAELVERNGRLYSPEGIASMDERANS